MKKSIFLLFAFVSFLVVAQEEYATGLEFNEEKYDSVPLSAPILSRSFTNLPSKYSLKPYTPTPGNQGKQPSCVGWASGYGARTIAYAIKNDWKNNRVKIDQNAFSPSFVYNQIKAYGDTYCTRGSYIEDAMNLLNKKH